MNIPLVLLMAGGDPGSAPSGVSGGILGFLPFILIIVVVYFLMLRPQMKRQKEQKGMMSEIKAGDDIVTIGGMHGTIAGIRDKDNSLIVKVGDNTKLIFDRAAIARVVSKADGSDKKV
ncbi:MAG: preprotein translocase subunit YajC [Candidatus Electryonea clarkiae]|nr:preprotein translocase subunit YajC [Candidatus Electryonea clarkiae]MDP8286870.1 preprotein translocase subunit YajC [Candidatus Electryonea clarkiae]